MSRARHRTRVVEAAALLGLVGAIVRVMAFDRSMKVTGATLGSGAPESRTTNSVAIDVGLALESAVRRLPWKPTCLEQAMAGSLMLRRRGLRGVVCLGVATTRRGLEAHACLTLDRGAVCGGETALRFTPFAKHEAAG